MSRRREQMASALMRAVQEVIGRGLNDPRIRGMITVTGAQVSPDRRDATISVSIFPESEESLSMHGLQSATRHIRRQVGELLETARMPELHFRIDRTAKREAAVLAALERAKETPRPGGWTADAEPPPSPAPTPDPDTSEHDA